MVRFAVILGSVRPASVGAPVAQWVARKASTVEGVQADVITLAELGLPFFAEPAPPSLAAPTDPAGAAWNERLAAYDGVVIVTPEYDHSVPGVLKNAIDFLRPGVLAYKPVGLVGYSYYNGIRPLEHLRDILSGFDVSFVNPEVLLSLRTDFTEGAFTPAAYHEDEVPAMVRAMVARSQALSPLR